MRQGSAIRALFAAALASLAIAPMAPPPAQESPYQSVFVVTGTGETNRMTGFAETLRQVLVKLSGDQRLASDPRVTELMKDAKAYVAGYTYLDLKSGIHLSDEQGSYDRPHYLTVDFDHEKLNAVLASLGRKPWLARPRLTVFLGVSRYAIGYVAASDSDRDAAMRDSFANASRRYGVKINFPDQASVVASLPTFDALQKADAASLNAIAKGTGGDQALIGTLVWSDPDHGWIADWRIAVNSEAHHWQLKGISFDDAFRSALAGAAQVLSGNGQPD